MPNHIILFQVTKNTSIEVGAGNRVRRQVSLNHLEDHQAIAEFESRIDDPLNRSFPPSSQPNVPGSEKLIPSEPKSVGLGSNRPGLGVPRSSIRKDKFWLNNRVLPENKEFSKLLPQNTKTKSTTDLESTSTQASSQATTASTTDSTDEPADESTTEPTSTSTSKSTTTSSTESNDASTTESNDASTTEPTTEAESITVPTST